MKIAIAFLLAMCVAVTLAQFEMNLGQIMMMQHGMTMMQQCDKCKTCNLAFESTQFCATCKNSTVGVCRFCNNKDMHHCETTCVTQCGYYIVQ